MIQNFRKRSRGIAWNINTLHFVVKLQTTTNYSSLPLKCMILKIRFLNVSLAYVSGTQLLVVGVALWAPRKQMCHKNSLFSVVGIRNLLPPKISISFVNKRLE